MRDDDGDASDEGDVVVRENGIDNINNEDQQACARLMRKAINNRTGADAQEQTEKVAVALAGQLALCERRCQRRADR